MPSVEPRTTPTASGSATCGPNAAPSLGRPVPPSARATTALRDQPGISELDSAEVYRGVAGDLGPDVDAVTAVYRAPASRAKARADFRTLRVLSHPALLLDTAHAPTRWEARPPQWLP
ncbi:hypothetical protein [Streptomyces canus]|uniref:hypothetical protein n=1 Tax=Streptomyces canus TaxID=58343 RepID=UPI0037FE5FC0